MKNLILPNNSLQNLAVNIFVSIVLTFIVICLLAFISNAIFNPQLFI